MVTFCVHCGQGIDVGLRAQEGQRMHCPRCGAYLEIISVEPLELDWVYDGPFVEPLGVCQVCGYEMDGLRR